MLEQSVLGIRGCDAAKQSTKKLVYVVLCCKSSDDHLSTKKQLVVVFKNKSLDEDGVRTHASEESSA